MSKLTLSCGNEITLNDDQISALKHITNFLKKKSPQFLCLKGSAGTGKTTITRAAIAEYSGLICVTAPTHKAANVIKRVTGYPSQTLHSLLGLRPDMSLEEFTEKNLVFSLSDKTKKQGIDYDLIVIDEASMINSHLLELIKKSKFKKVLFMGDDNQLPPVNEDYSPVFCTEGIKVVSLKKVERQKDGNPLLSYFSELLANIDGEKILEMKWFAKMVGDCGIMDFYDRDSYSAMIFDKFKKDPIETKMICYTNKKVTQYNRYIRKGLLGVEKPNHVCVGDILMGYRTIRDKTETLVQNSTDYIVDSVEGGVKSVEVWKAGVTSTVSINGFNVSLRNILSYEVTKIFVVSPDSYDEFSRHEKYLSGQAKNERDQYKRKYKWSKYFEYKNEFFILGDCDGIIKDLDFGYAITCHKSQGSTYDNVFVDIRDLETNTNNRERNRLLYVAMSRPRKAAYCWIG